METIRLATASDAAAVAAIYAPFCATTVVSFEESAPTADEMATRIARVTARYPWLVLEHKGTIAGYAYASQHRERAAYRWAVDVAVYVHERFRRKGVGRALYAALFPILDAQGYRRVYAGVALPNAGSEGLHEAVGFQVVGVYRRVGWKLGAWRDVRWYQLSLSDGEPGALLPVGDVKGGAAWDEAVRAGLALYRG
jgi:phosphinothricin acetyltransferase